VTVDTLTQDIRIAVRSLLRTRGLALIAILCFGLGIGANTAIFSAVRAVVLQSLPYKHPESLVKVSETYLARGVRGVASVSPPVYLEWARRKDLFDGVAAYTTSSTELGDVAEPERLRAVRVTGDAFSVLGATPLIGRSLTAADALPGAARAVVISEGLWRRRFGANNALVGSAITLGGAKYTVVGVMAERFDFPISPLRNDVWVPLDFANLGGVSSWGSRGLQVVARLATGVDSARAYAALDGLARQLGNDVPLQRNRGIAMSSLLGAVVGKVRLGLLVLLGTVGVVLLVACANVANLLLARGETRRREFAVRVSLGATRGRLVRQLLTETVVLSVAGGAVGIAIAWQSTRALSRLVVSVLPRADDISIDARVLLFAGIVSIATGVVVGLVPAVRAARSDPGHDLSDANARSSGGRQRGRTLSALIVFELALSLVLLVGASLMVRSFAALLAIDVGFRGERVATFHIAAPRQIADSLRFEQFYASILDGARALPGVTAAGMTSTLPIQDGATDRYFSIVGRLLPPGEHLDAEIRIVSSDYFKTMGIPVVAGREFAASDTRSAPRVIIVNQTLAAQHFSDENPLGHLIDVGEGTPATIVGVVKSVHQIGVDQDPRAEFYIPASQARYNTQAMAVVIATRGDPAAIEPFVPRLVRSVDPTRPIYELGTMTSVIADSLAPRRMLLVLLVLFAGLAIVLAAAGLYGVLSYVVAQRTREIGIRLALGAVGRDVATMVLRDTARIIVLGIAIGLGTSLLATGVLRSLLYGVSARDPLTFVATPALLAIIALLASLVPALRAARVDPLVSMRTE